MVDEVLKVPAGEWLLQTAAASVLGRQVIQVGLPACPLTLRWKLGFLAWCTPPLPLRLPLCCAWLSLPCASHLPIAITAGPRLALFCSQLAKHRGIKTINVVRRQEVADELKALG